MVLLWLILLGVIRLRDNGEQFIPEGPIVGESAADQFLRDQVAQRKRMADLQGGQPDNTEGLLAPAGVEVDRPPQDDPNQNIYITNWNTFKQSFDNAAVQGLPAQLYKSARNVADQYIFNSDVLYQDQVSQLKKDRPGIVFPEGVTRNLANDLVNDYDAQRAREELLSHSKPTVGGKVSGFLGNTMGTIIGDPISTAIATGAGIASKDVYAIPEMIGIERQWIKIALGRAAQGAIEGAAFGVGQQAGQSLEKISSGDTLDGVEALQNIGDSMFLGGLLHPIGGAFSDLLSGNKAFTQLGAEDASQTAASMMANGKDGDASLSLRNAFNMASDQFQKKVENSGKSVLEVNEELAKQHQEISDRLQQDIPDDEKENLNNTLRSVEIHQAMLNNSEKEIPKDVFDDFVRKNMVSSSDFANGLGQAELDVAGPDFKSSDNLLNARFPEDERQRLLDNTTLDDEDRETLNSFDDFEKKRPQVEGGIDTLIRCITGAVR